MIPKPITERREKQRRGLSRHPREGQKNACNDPLGRRSHYDVKNRLPPTDSKSKRRFPVAIGDKQEHFLSRTHDQRNHQQPKGKTAGIG